MITVYTLEKSEKWDSVVKSFQDYDVYYLSGYVKAFHINGDGDPILIYFESADTRAINVVIKRDIADCEHFKDLEKGQLFDIVTPYGYGGWLIEGNDFDTLKKEYEAFCVKENIVSEFVRFNPLLENWKGFSDIYETIHLGDTVYIDTTFEDVIWQNISSKNRNVIRKAQKSGLKVYWGRDPEIIEPFMEIYNATMDKDSASDYYYFDTPFYESVLEDLKQNSMWFYAKTAEGEIAAIAIFMFCNGKMHYHLSASRREYQNLAPTNLILYEAAVWGANHGCKRLHLGGGVGSAHDNLYKFKKAFNRGNDTEFWIGKNIFKLDVYERLLCIRKGQGDFVDNSYFPVYRSDLLDRKTEGA